MKKEFEGTPKEVKESWPGQLSHFAWSYYVAAIPSPLFLVTSYKSNGKENACLSSWSTFLGDKGEFICLLGSVSKGGHLLKTLEETGCCVLNFPSRQFYKKCEATIRNNGFEDDEITLSGLTAEQAKSVNAPRVKECFLNIECEFLWAKEHFEGSRELAVALRAKHIAMDSDYYDQNKLGRYGKTGYMYNVHSPRNPETDESIGECYGALELYKD